MGKPPNTASAAARVSPMTRRSAKLFLATSGSSARPGQAKRCSAMTSGDGPEVTPGRAATKPNAQNKAAPAPHAIPHAVECFAISEPALAIGGYGLRSASAGEEFVPACGSNAAFLEPHHIGRDLAHLRSDMADINHRNAALIAQADEIRQ